MGSDAQCIDKVLLFGDSLRNAVEDPGPGDFRRLAEHLAQMVWVCQPGGALAYLNPHALSYFGLRLPEVAAVFPSGPLAHPNDRERLKIAWQHALETQESFSAEARLLRTDGAYRWHLLRGDPVRDANGHVIKWMGSSANVHSVKEGNELSAFLLELSTDFARMDNPHELVSTAMYRLRQHLGAAQVTLAEFDATRRQVVMLRQDHRDGADLQVINLPMGPYESLDSEARKGKVTVLHDVPQDPHAARLYNRWCGLQHVGAIISAPLLHGGTLIASLTVVDESRRHWTTPEIELTKRVAEIVWPALEKARADHALAVSEQRLRLAQAVAQIGAWELDPDAESIRFSAESFELFGLNEGAQSNLYQLWVSLIDPRDRNVLNELVRQCIESGSGVTEYRYRHPARGLRWIHCRAGSIDEGEARSIVGISLDVTERRLAEDALKEVNQRKDEFLAMLAHELRNPLAPIRNAAQILRKHSTGQPELEWARTVIERQTCHLVRLVDDLLDVSRMIRGKIVLKRSAVEIAELIQHAVDTSQPLIRSRKHRLHVNVQPGPLSVDGDLTRLAQALANLLNNAAKYTDEGGQIWLDAWREGRRVFLRVRDTGPGISPALLPHVFELFTQAERTLDRAQGGLGIGLTLVKLLVEMHGGTVEARNGGPAQGAEFLVGLAANEVQPPQALSDQTQPSGDPARADLAPLKVLVVDDNVDAADSIALLLSIDGFEASSVHGAVAALERVESFAPQVVLLDIGLPVMDGYEVARRMRARIPADKLKIVALSGYGQQTDRERAARAGFDDYLVKPVEPGALSDFLRSLR